MQENPILARLQKQLGVGAPPTSIDPAWLFTLITVLEVDRYSLDDWNGALSAILGRRIFCPSYQTLSRRIQEAMLERSKIVKFL